VREGSKHLNKNRVRAPREKEKRRENNEKNAVRAPGESKILQ
jgi:hypothetical protein